MLKRQLRASDFFLAQVDVFSELSDGIQWGVVLKAQPTDLQNVKSTPEEKGKSKSEDMFT